MSRRKSRLISMPNKQQLYSWENLLQYHKQSVFIAAICCCLIITVYMNNSTPNAELDLKENGKQNWFERKKSWELKELDGHQFSLVNNSVKIERLKNEYLRYFLVVRPSGSEKIVQVKRFIIKTMKNMGWTVEEDSFKEKPPDPYSKTRFTNVIATYNPAAKRKLVLACHYDSKIEPEGFLGAIDSAVPCSMMMEIATALRDFLPQIKSDLTLQFIFFDGEEAFKSWSATDSLYGARHLAKKWSKEKFPANSQNPKTVLDSIDLLVLLDLLGSANPTFSDMHYTYTRHYKRFIQLEKNLKDNIAYFMPQTSYSYIDDDHAPFLKRGVPVLHLIPVPFPPQWHKLSDNEENIDNFTISRLTRLIAVFVCEYLHLEPKSA